jgi:hypothetical protein
VIRRFIVRLPTISRDFNRFFSKNFRIYLPFLLLQSAIKAKLLELGTGSQSGYIDDELPDYVMIMVANKRSKSQMTQDLTLFLGSNTGELWGSFEVYREIDCIFP